MQELLLLLKRDTLLIKMSSGKRLIYVSLVSLLLNALYYFNDTPSLIRRSLLGVDAPSILENPLMFPVHWLLLQLSGIFVLYDFFRRDFYENASCVLVRLEKRGRFGQSKLTAGAIVCLLLTVIHGCIYVGIGILLPQTPDPEEQKLTTGACLLSMLFLFFGMFTAYCIFQLAALLSNTGIGMIAALLFLCMGITSESACFPINHIMPIRSRMIDPAGTSAFWQSALSAVLLLIILFIAVRAAVSKLDVYGNEGE